MKYAAHLSPTVVPQTQALEGQVKNSAGGYAFKLPPLKRLERFLILGCEGGSYYASERKLTLENAKCVLEAADADPMATVDLVTAISREGRAPKNDPAIFALALLSTHKEASFEALHRLPYVCRTGTHLFQFVDAVNSLRGWGRGLRTAVADWYTGKDADTLAMQVTKYAQREGWSHRDVLRLAHPNPNNCKPPIKDVLQYVAQKDKWLTSLKAGNRLLVTVEEAKTASESQIVRWIKEEGLVREHIPTEHLNSKAIWEALLYNMPATATIRNLGKMTSIGLISPLSSASKTIAGRLRDVEFLKKGRVHPFSILLALSTYQSGHGFKGSLTWNPDQQIVAALNDAFVLSFGAVEPTGKNFLLGIDVSGSMSSPILGSNIQCREAAACMAMVAMKTEPASMAFGFTSKFEDLKLNASMDFNTVRKNVYHSNFGSTDCSVPMDYATANKIPVDVFCVYTDNETYAGKSHPHIALEQYRQKMGRDAKLIVAGMTATEFTIANPDDAGMLDVVGFDSSAPEAMRAFALMDTKGSVTKGKVA